MSRKGVLLSDPSVQEMTYAQWLIEAAALQKREDGEREERQNMALEIYKAAARTFRETLIHVLGANIGAGKAEEGEPTPYIPLMTTLARGEVVEELLKRESDEKQASEVLDDENMDQFAEELMNIDMGDLEPVFKGKNSDDPFERWASKDNVELMKQMGVELHEGGLNRNEERE